MNIMADTLPKRPRPIAAIFFVLGLLTTEGVLFASERFQWFAFNREKGLTVLVTVALVGVAMIAFLIAIGVSRLLRRPAQFGLGTVFVLVVLAAVPFSWLASECERARRQAALVQLIEADGGSVSYYSTGYSKLQSMSLPFGRPNPKTPSVVRDSLSSVLGVDFFFDVAEVELAKSTLVDQLHRLPHLRSLHMPFASPLDVARLPCLKELECIDLSGTQFSDDSFSFLAALPKLNILYLHDTNLTDAGLKQFHDMDCVYLISLSDTEVTDAGIDSFKEQFPDAIIFNGFTH